jgi:hypothetical protein
MQRLCSSAGQPTWQEDVALGMSAQEISLISLAVGSVVGRQAS